VCAGAERLGEAFEFLGNHLQVLLPKHTHDAIALKLPLNLFSGCVFIVTRIEEQEMMSNLKD
jgi:hypothetical protein